MEVEVFKEEDFLEASGLAELTSSNLCDKDFLEEEAIKVINTTVITVIMVEVREGKEVKLTHLVLEEDKECISNSDLAFF